MERYIISELFNQASWDIAYPCGPKKEKRISYSWNVPKHLKANNLHIANRTLKLVGNNTGKIFKTLSFLKTVSKTTKAWERLEFLKF